MFCLLFEKIFQLSLNFSSSWKWDSGLQFSSGSFRPVEFKCKFNLFRVWYLDNLDAKIHSPKSSPSPRVSIFSFVMWLGSISKVNISLFIMLFIFHTDSFVRFPPNASPALYWYSKPPFWICLMTGCRPKAHLYGQKVVPGKRVTLPAESTLASLYMRKSWPLCLSQELAFHWQWRSCMLWSPSLDLVDWASQSVYLEKLNVGPAGRITLPLKEGDPAKQVTLLAEPTFLLSCKRFVSFFGKEM